MEHTYALKHLTVQEYKKQYLRRIFYDNLRCIYSKKLRRQKENRSLNIFPVRVWF